MNSFADVLKQKEPVTHISDLKVILPPGSSEENAGHVQREFADLTQKSIAARLNEKGVVSHYKVESWDIKAIVVHPADYARSQVFFNAHSSLTQTPLANCGYTRNISNADRLAETASD